MGGESARKKVEGGGEFCRLPLHPAPSSFFSLAAASSSFSAGSSSCLADAGVSCDRVGRVTHSGPQLSSRRGRPCSRRPRSGPAVEAKCQALFTQRLACPPSRSGAFRAQCAVRATPPTAHAPPTTRPQLEAAELVLVLHLRLGRGHFRKLRLLLARAGGARTHAY